MIYRFCNGLISCSLVLFAAPFACAHEGCEHDHDHAAHAHEEHDHDHAEHEHAHEGCDHDHAAHEHSVHDATHSAHAHASESVLLRVDARSRHILNMQVETIPDTGLALTHSLYGYLVSPGHAQETYSLPCAGRINLRVKTAQQVKKGDVLYTLVSPVFADQLAEKHKLESNKKRCMGELELLRARVQRLHAAGARNGELEEQLGFKIEESRQLESDIEIATNRLFALSMGMGYEMEEGLPVIVVRAHEDGVVHNVGVTQNSWGEQGAPVITMSAPAAMEVVGTLYASDLPKIAEVRATLPLGRESVALTGTWRLADQVDATTQTRALFFTPTNLPAEARAGQLCRMDIYDMPAEEGVVSIPDSALVKVGTDDVVFVEVGEGEYAMVKVHAGESRRGMTPVAGLHPGQKIVVKGGYELKYSLPTEKETKKAGHFHADGKFHEGED